MNKSKNSKRIEFFGMFDYTLLFIVLFLLCFGLVMLYSVSSYEANLKFQDSAYYLKKQLFATIFGVVVLFLTTILNYHFWDKAALFAYFVSLGLIL
ncbi:MAG: FtsW/RodA/SpoVE family cell cycle protein, partial [Parasporobacterium sp.]|nr:FtsW/RodA/SpoVE family cell cycle protein [Parasporobacterium sp.]